MATKKQSRKRRLNMAERAKQQMEIQFPDYPDELLWLRTLNDGYSTVPRTLPLAMQVIDSQSKGQPAGHTLLCLWIRAPDYPFLTIEAPATFAAETGFDGERAVDTWRRRMRTLRDLGFIEAKKGPSGDFHYVLLLNPNVCIEKLRRANKVRDVLYGRFRDRLIDIGAQSDIDITIYDDHPKKAESVKAKTAKSSTASPKTSSKAAGISANPKRRSRLGRKEE
ncbi:MAG: hypothetical protein ACK4SX_12525 [Alcanivoracaceae bacterium]